MIFVLLVISIALIAFGYYQPNEPTVEKVRSELRKF